MARYIEVDALITYANNQKDKTIDANDIARFPWADVRENIHAHWDKVEVRSGEWWHTCSKCKATWGSEDGELDFNYCPNCGAVIDERREDANKAD